MQFIVSVRLYGHLELEPPGEVPLGRVEPPGEIPLRLWYKVMEVPLDQVEGPWTHWKVLW